MTNQNKMPDAVYVTDIGQNKLWVESGIETGREVSYTRTDLYTAAIADSRSAIAEVVRYAEMHGRLQADYDALWALCEGMAEKLRLIDGLDGEINLSNYTDTDVSYLNGQFVQAILTAEQALTAYEKHKGVG